MGYFLIFSLSLFGGNAVINASKIKNKKKAMLFFSLLVLVFFCGSQEPSHYGTDIMNYYNISKESIGLDFSYFVNYKSSFSEKGFNAFVWLVSNLFESPQAYMYFQALFVCGTFLFFIYDNCDDFFLGIITYICLICFTFYFTAYRQGVACSIALWAIYLLKRNKFVIPILLIILSTQFHRTAIVMLPIVFFSKFKLDFKYFFTFTIAVIIISLFLDVIIDLANDELETKYSGVGNYSSNLGPLINIVVFFIAFLLTYISYSSKNKLLYNNDTSFNLFVFMGLSGAFLYLGRYIGTQALERVAFYFTPAFIVLLPNAVSRCKGLFKEDLILKYGFIVLSLILFYVRFGDKFTDFVFWFM